MPEVTPMTLWAVFIVLGIIAFAVIILRGIR